MCIPCCGGLSERCLCTRWMVTPLIFFPPMEHTVSAYSSCSPWGHTEHHVCTFWMRMSILQDIETRTKKRENGSGTKKRKIPNNHTHALAGFPINLFSFYLHICQKFRYFNQLWDQNVVLSNVICMDRQI